MKSREAADRPCRVRVAHVLHPEEELAEYPAAERPEWIPRRMGNSEMRARRRELARVFEPDRRPEREEINGESRNRGRPERGPIELGEKPVFFHKGVLYHIFAIP